LNKVFPRYAEKSLEDFQIIDPSHEEALQTAKDYMLRLPECRVKGIGLTILGPAGVGKTFLASMIMKCAKEEGDSIECIEASTYIEMHQQRMILDGEDELEVHQHIRRIQRVKLLLLDDIGREHVGDSGWANTIIFNTLRFRYNRCLPFLVTANLSLDGLTDRYSQGLTSILHEVTEFIVIEGEDARCRKDS